MNTTKCQKCGYSLIIEELPTHECKDVIDYKIKGDILWLFDGEIWYPRKLRSARSDDFLHRELSDGDSPEPLKDGFKYYASFLLFR
jgi:hypothetical protein